MLCLALHLTAVAVAINHDAEPYVISMVNNASMTRRRKQSRSHEAVSQAPNTPLPQYHNENEHGVPYFGKPAMTPHEVEGQQTQISELGSGREVSELPA
jgi:nitrate reductase cytochrome c-type subunit